VLISVAGVAVLLAGVAVFSVHAQPSPKAVVALSAVQDLGAAPSSLQRSAHSLVSLSLHQGTTTEQTDGVAIDALNVVTTTALPQGSSVSVLSSKGQRLAGVVLAHDAASGLSLVQMSNPLLGVVGHAATSRGGPYMVLTMTVVAQDASVKWATASLARSERTVSHEQLPLAVLRASSSLNPEAGALLVDVKGAVVGVAAPELGTDAYLPISFVVKVGEHLISSSSPEHGYLGIECTDAPNGGAQVLSVDGTGPSAGQLVPGDVIIEVDSSHISSMADLVDALYPMPAPSTISLQVKRSGSTRWLSLALAPSP
jgi:S1-C subfamily serine protease